MGDNTRTCFVGDKFVLGCGVEVTVVEYVNSFNVTVEDDLGRRRVTRLVHLKDGSVSWFEYGKRIYKMAPLELGEVFTLNCGVAVTVVGLGDATNTYYIADALGNRKLAAGGKLVAGNVGWLEFGVATGGQAFTVITLGTEIVLPCGVTVTVVEYNNHKDVVIEDSLGNRITTSASRLRYLDVNWKMFQNADDGILNPVDGMYYVYTAEYDGEIVYVGKGKGDRYKHTYSGISSSRYLNMLYFSGERVAVAIHKDNLTSEDAYALEQELIQTHQPLGNTINKGRYWLSPDYCIEKHFKLPRKTRSCSSRAGCEG